MFDSFVSRTNEDNLFSKSRKSFTRFLISLSCGLRIGLKPRLIGMELYSRTARQAILDVIDNSCVRV